MCGLTGIRPNWGLAEVGKQNSRFHVHVLKISWVVDKVQVNNLIYFTNGSLDSFLKRAGDAADAPVGPGRSLEQRQAETCAIYLGLRGMRKI
jgi:hypothetical protein